MYDIVSNDAQLESFVSEAEGAQGVGKTSCPMKPRNGCDVLRDRRIATDELKKRYGFDECVFTLLSWITVVRNVSYIRMWLIIFSYFYAFQNGRIFLQGISKGPNLKINCFYFGFCASRCKVLEIYQLFAQKKYRRKCELAIDALRSEILLRLKLIWDTPKSSSALP